MIRHTPEKEARLKAKQGISKDIVLSVRKEAARKREELDRKRKKRIKRNSRAT